MTRLAFAFSALALLLGAPTAQAQSKVATACPGHVQGVYFYRGVTRKWERKIGKTPSKSHFNASKVRSCNYVIWLAHTWQARAANAQRQYKKKLAADKAAQGALTSDWACIHRYEGSWTANTGNGYYGGLQMDYGFMRSYGSEFMARWGTADRWPVWAQVSAANRAKNSGRGYGPWPNTARACGLL